MPWRLSYCSAGHVVARPAGLSQWRRPPSARTATGLLGDHLSLIAAVRAAVRAAAVRLYATKDGQQALSGSAESA